MSSNTKKPRVHPLRLTLVVLFTGASCLAGAVLAINTSPRLLAALLGIEQVESLTNALPSEPAPLTLEGERLDHAEFLLPPQIVEPRKLTFSDAGEGEEPGDPLIGNSSSPGTTRYLLNLDEDGVNRLLWELILPDGLKNDRYRDLTVDLQPGGFIVYADVDLGIRWQRMGLLLLQDSGTLTLSPAGVVLNGSLYGMPETGSLAHLLLPTGRRAQRTLHALTIVGPLPGEARVEAARFRQEGLQILAQANYASSTLADTGWRVLEPGVELREMDVGESAGRSIERLSIVRLDPADLQIGVHYDPDSPRTVSAWASRLDALLVVNGGFFAPEREGRHETIGLLISGDQRWGTPLHDHAGMLAVTTAGEASVRWLRHRPYDPAEPLAEAMQSFPVLVKPGGLMGFPADADNGEPARRTVVAQDDDGNILFLVAPRGTLSLHELAVVLTESGLAVDVALNLDGGGSTGMWLTAADVQVSVDSFTPVPSVIAVEKP